MSDIQLTNAESKLFQDIRSVVADLKLGTVVRVAGDNFTYYLLLMLLISQQPLQKLLQRSLQMKLQSYQHLN